MGDLSLLKKSNRKFFPAKKHLFEVSKVTLTQNVEINSIVSACSIYILLSSKLDGLINKMFVWYALMPPMPLTHLYYLHRNQSLYSESKSNDWFLYN